MGTATIGSPVSATALASRSPIHRRRFRAHLQADSLRATEAVQKHLSPRRLAELAANHPRFTKKEAIALALGTPSAVGSPDETKSPLTAHENKVARLVGEGLSNRAIAQTLVLSPRTVEGHVENILGNSDSIHVPRSPRGLPSRRIPQVPRARSAGTPPHQVALDGSAQTDFGPLSGNDSSITHPTSCPAGQLR